MSDKLDELLWRCQRATNLDKLGVDVCDIQPLLEELQKRRDKETEEADLADNERIAAEIVESYKQMPEVTR